MKARVLAGFVVGAVLAIGSGMLPLSAQTVTTGPKIDETLLREANAALRRGTNYLLGKQAENGSWGGYGGHPAVTGLICMALNGAEVEDNAAARAAAVERGRKYILGFVQEDGSIWMKGREKEYPNYTTAIALATLATISREEDVPVMRKARKYLQGSQVIDPSSDAFGGIGYATAGPGKPDLSNTQWALEALYMTDYLDEEPMAEKPEDTKRSELAWRNAVQFLSKLQHVPETNDMQWVVKDKNDPNYGGFVYKSDESKASAEGETLRSYGSMTYAGLKSMIYARLDKKDDPRIKAAVEWASKNYTLDENPGMEAQGHYYYLHTFAKAHAVLGEETVKLADGREANWRTDIIKKMLALQKGEGEWFNERHARWWESNPEMVTAYALLTLEAALGPLL
jgi:squalene-hopene/tetraprenyl-beta-curcumene cyclase